jgi:predicted Zn-dependent protease
LADQRGIDALKSIFTNCSGEQPAGSCVNSALFNTYGYELLRQHRSKDALVIFEIVAWAHPYSAIAQDSLADALFAVGEEKRARAAMECAIDLVPTDPTINSEAKSTFIGDEQRRLDQLK